MGPRGPHVTLKLPKPPHGKNTHTQNKTKKQNKQKGRLQKGGVPAKRWIASLGDFPPTEVVFDELPICLFQFSCVLFFWTAETFRRSGFSLFGGGGRCGGGVRIRDRPKTVWEGTVSNTELSEFSFDLTEFWGESSVSLFRPIIFLCKSELTEFFAELAEIGSEFTKSSLPKQYSRNRIPPVPKQKSPFLSLPSI